MLYLFQQLLNILQIGSIYAMIALGYTMVYGVLLLINFAHGDLFMIGAFITFLSATYLNFGFIPSLILSMTATALLGVTIERTAYKPLRNAPKVSVIITALGVGVFLENLTLAISPYPKHVPQLIENTIYNIKGLTLSLVQIIIITFSVVLMIGLDFLVRKTKLGMAIRAISWDMQAVPLMGIPLNKIISITFAIGAGLGGAAGVFYAAAYPVIDPYMGIMVGWKAFIAAVVGGIGNIRGAMLGGYALGAIEVAVMVFLPTTYRDLISFLLLFILLIFRPYGIFGKPRNVKI
ncbi:MAG: branched-chain amino acid ABC transporter permease [Nitrospirae bacterium]|nr:branched-chain amino acid ABC transporter permease [Nitrospirota bacterium]MBF0541469.1 branched-chain amino acid ABC transporter permease [Nitrospirota bacterium]